MTNGNHSVALWAGLTALFTNLAAVGVIDFFGTPDKTNTAIAAVITSMIVAAGVYAKQRWDDAKQARDKQATPGDI